MNRVEIVGDSVDLFLILAVGLFVALPALVLGAACVAAWLAKPETDAGAETWGALDIDHRWKGRRQ